MKKSLLFQGSALLVIIILSSATLWGQTIILSENFSGFTSGTHGDASTSDASSTLDSKTSTPGWAGSKIYSAGGEIKVGTASLTGWIETPAIDLSANGGNFIVTFDICRYSGDASTVQVNLNGAVIGSIITPVDTFQIIQITGTGGTTSSKIKVVGITKRFYLDNFAIRTNLPTVAPEAVKSEGKIKIYPVPAVNELTIESSFEISFVEILDFSGRIVKTVKTLETEIIRIPVSYIPAGMYLVRLTTSHGIRIMRFVKS